jgi:hypothetical protein
VQVGKDIGGAVRGAAAPAEGDGQTAGREGIPVGLAREFEDTQWPVVGFLTAEHTTLTNLRTATISETNGRAAAYLATVSAGVVALGLVGNAGFDRDFFAFGMLVLAPPVLVGLLTFGRSLQSSVEDIRLAERIERLRSVYGALLPHLAESFQAPAADSRDILRRVIGPGLPGPWQLLLTLAGLIATVNSFVTGVILGFAVHLAAGTTSGAVISAAVVTVLSFVGYMAIQARAFRSRA